MVADWFWLPRQSGFGYSGGRSRCFPFWQGKSINLTTRASAFAVVRMGWHLLAGSGVEGAGRAAGRGLARMTTTHNRSRWTSLTLLVFVLAR